MAKKYTNQDLAAVETIASQFKLKYWRLENVFGQELKKCSVLSKNQLAEVFNYINSDFVDDGEYILVGKAGNQSKAETKLRLTKGTPPAAGAPAAGTSIVNYSYPENYEALVKENAELRADKYYLEQLIIQKDLKIEELLEELNEQPEQGKLNINDLVKEYTPQAFNLLQSIFVKPAPMPAFADPAPAAVPKLTRCTPEYYAYLKANAGNTALLEQELNYIQTNNPGKLDEWQTNIFG
jgi:hypothetical protein